MKINQLHLLVTFLLLIAVAFLLFKDITSSGNKMAYVESKRLLTNYQGMKDVVAVYQQKATVWQANIDTLKTELQQTIKSHEDSKSTMTQKELGLSEQLIRNKQDQLRKYQQSIKGKMAQEDQKMTAKVLDDVNAFIQQYGKEEGYQIIMGATEAGNIIYSEKALNITDEVIEELNSRYEK